MYVKKIKRICGVRGCKNTDVFALSKTREMGNSVIICKDCLKDALASIDSYVEPEKVKTERKPLFYHPELEVTVPSVAENEPEPPEVIEEAPEDADITVTEDTVTIVYEPKPSAHNPKTTTNAKKKPNKKK
jgi:outer membrane biosynthesis protein TonB